MYTLEHVYLMFYVFVLYCVVQCHHVMYSSFSIIIETIALMKVTIMRERKNIVASKNIEGELA